MTIMKRMSAVAAVTVALVSMSGCSMFDDDIPAGAIGIARGDGGDPVAVVLVCARTIDHIEVVKMLGDGKSTPIGELVAKEAIGGGVHRVNLVHPDSNWTATTPLEMVPGLIVADAWGERKKAGTGQTSFEFDQLDRLRPDQVTGFDHAVPLSDLAVDRCGNMAQ